MINRLQVVVTDATALKVEELLKEANANFNDGTVTVSDLCDMAFETATFNVEKLRARKTNAKKVLKRILQENPKASAQDIVEELLRVTEASKKAHGKKPIVAQKAVK